MDVVLLKDVEKVGLRGEVVSVARGYMRNYLEPRRLAEPATPALVAEIERREADEPGTRHARLEQAQAIAETLSKTVLRFEVKAGTQGVLFGSITPTDVADELWRVRKVRVDRRKIDLAEPIERIGRYEIPIDVFPEVRVDVKTLVVPEGGELARGGAGGRSGRRRCRERGSRLRALRRRGSRARRRRRRRRRGSGRARPVRRDAVGDPALGRFVSRGAGNPALVLLVPSGQLPTGRCGRDVEVHELPLRAAE